MSAILTAIALLLAASGASAAEATAPQTDSEAWNLGVDLFRAGDATNAMSVLKPLMLSETHGPRAAELVAKLAFDAGDREEAAAAAQLALRAAPDDGRANRNFTRATNGLLEAREAKRIGDVLKASQGKDPGALLLSATRDARRLFSESGSFLTNAPARAVALGDRMSAEAERLADVWIPVRQTIVQSVTNEEQSATILGQIEQAEARTKAAARALGDLDSSAYAALSDVEHDLTRFLKLAVMPPAALQEDLVAQSNAWQDVESFNGRDWQADALDYTRAFRAKFPAWAREYESRAQSDTNLPPFTAEAQAEVSALATELEKRQQSSSGRPIPSDQEEAVRIIVRMMELLPKDGGGGGGNPQGGQQQQSQGGGRQDRRPPEGGEGSDERRQDDGAQEEERDSGDHDGQSGEEAAEEEVEEDQELESVLKKAQERNDEHEADKKARMRKAPLPPNERDW